MKTLNVSILIVSIGLLLAALALVVVAQNGRNTPTAPASVGTAFTYQGVLTDNGQPADGEYDLQFRLYDTTSGGNQIGNVVTIDNHAVSDGLLTVTLDFGTDVFGGSPRFLEIGVRPSSSTGSYETLAARQPLTASPYAIHAYSAESLSAADGDPAAAMSVDADGNVGIGTTSPEAILHLYGDGISLYGPNSGWGGYLQIGGSGYSPDRASISTSDGTLYLDDKDGGSGTFINYYSQNNTLLNAQGGNVGIGTINPEAPLHLGGDRYTLYGPNSVGARLQVGGYGRVGTNASIRATTGDLFIDAQDGNYATFINYYSQNNTRINELGGNVGIRTANPVSAFQVGNSGDGTVAVANAWNTFSDERYKTNIVELENASELVRDLEGVRFNWKNTDEESIGFVAQDVQAVLPELVHADEAGYLSVDYAKITPVLVEALQEQQTTIDTLQAQNEQMAQELAEIRTQLAAMNATSARFSVSGWGVRLMLLAGLGVFAWQRKGGDRR